MLQEVSVPPIRVSVCGFPEKIEGKRRLCMSKVMLPAVPMSIVVVRGVYV